MLDVLLVLMGTVIFYSIGILLAWVLLMYFDAKMYGDVELGERMGLVYGSWLLVILIIVVGSIALLHKKITKGYNIEELTNKFMTYIVEKDKG